MTAVVHRWLAEPLPADVDAALRSLASVPCVARVAVMPDVHLAHDVCVGTVVGARGVVLPAAVGADLGCGVATVRTTGLADAVDGAVAERVLDGLARLAPIHRHARRQPAPDALSECRLSAPALERRVRADGAVQFGTLGRGNHFLEVQADGDGSLWIMVHTGSRALGPAIRAHHLERARPVGGGLRGLDADSALGRAYLDDAAFAVTWARASRERLLLAASAVLYDTLGCEPEPDTLIDCHHDCVGCEVHGGEPLWVHRKGAVSATDGEPGLIPGSMGAPSYHVVGRGHPDAMCSSSHGAGRRLSRSEARAAIGTRELRRQLHGVHARLGPGLVEEAPAAYKDIGAVMRAQRALTRIVREVRPVVCHKGA